MMAGFEGKYCLLGFVCLEIVIVRVGELRVHLAISGGEGGILRFLMEMSLRLVIISLRNVLA